MIEGLIGIVTSIVESLVALLASLLELIAGLFVGAGETLAATDVILLLFVLLFEMFFWFILWIRELAVSLFKVRKPRPVAKPIFWRPKAKIKELDDNNKTKNT
jgi:hypothetical protein